MMRTHVFQRSHRVVVVLGAQLLRSLEVLHGPTESFVGELPAAWYPFLILALCAAFPNETGVVKPSRSSFSANAWMWWQSGLRRS